MKVIAISAGGSKTVTYRGERVETGIFKSAIESPVDIDLEGIATDTQVDRKNHGGPDKALYVYSLENLNFWARSRGDAPYPPGHLGENLTVEGLDDGDIMIGDVFDIGTARLEVTQPRVPCFKLGLRMDDPGFVAEFLYSGRTGFYCRVLQTGQISVGDLMHRSARPQDSIRIDEAMKCLIKGPEQIDWIHRALKVDALSAAWREDLQKRLQPSYINS